MKRFFFKNFIRIFAISLIILCVQTGSLLIEYSFSQNNWKTDVYNDFVATVKNWIESRYPKFLGFNDIGYYMSTVSDTRVSGVVVTDEDENIILTLGKAPNGKPIVDKAQRVINSRMDNTLFKIENNELSIFKSKVKAKIAIPMGIAANDIVGSVTISANGETLNAYLLSFSPRTYVYSKDIINSCLTTLIISLPVCIIIALISSWILSKKTSKQINRIRENLKELATGNYDTDLNCMQAESEFKQISESINDLANSLQANDKSQKAWLTSISHDLNTPITAIKMMLEGFTDNVIPKNKENLEILSQEVEQLQNRVERIILYSSLQTKKIKASIFTAKSLAEKLSEEYPKLKTEINDCKILADKNLVIMACEELLNNAYSYGKNVSLKISQDENVVISVENTGKLPVGIENSSLIQPWTRGDSARNNVGNGLGLSIASSIAQLHNGQVNIVQADDNKVVSTITIKK